MEYKKIENEIDNLLHNGGLNPYEKKLLRKVKRKFCFDRKKEKELYKDYVHKCVEVWDTQVTMWNEIDKRDKALKICYFYGALIFLVSIATIAYCLMK